VQVRQEGVGPADIVPELSEWDAEYQCIALQVSNFPLQEEIASPPNPGGSQ
jgi:hypothetical protein